MKDFTEKVGNILEKSNSEDNNINALPNSPNFSKSLRVKLGSLMNSRNCLKITKDEFGQANNLGDPIQKSGSDTITLNEKIYDLTLEIYKALSSTSYTAKTMKNENDVLVMNNFINDSGYTGIGDKNRIEKPFSQ